ncbi:MAG TPA: 4-hydroxy-tetrahydrodipicolinate synthase [Polyangiaceae bacterium]|nr:4-hydroxy-tetrahydrodipicolinate synthase [Polyangiaceae bacterium]
MTALPPGAYTALVTPFTPDGSSIDWAAFENLVASQIEGHIAGVVPCGTTGESATLSEAEQRDLIRRTVELARGRTKVVAGTGSNNTKKSIEASRAAVEAGVDGVMLVNPYYTKPSQEGLYQHFVSIARSVPCPVMLYNIPGRCSVELAVPTLLRILDACPNVVALKDASGGVSYCQDLLQQAYGRIRVFSGDDPLTVPMMSVGAEGVISVTSNLYPAQVSDLVSEMLAQRWQEAQRKDRRLLPIHRALFSEPSPQPIKAALSLKGRMNAAVRLPLVVASDACKERLSAVMSAFEAA